MEMASFKLERYVLSVRSHAAASFWFVALCYLRRVCLINMRYQGPQKKRKSPTQLPKARRVILTEAQLANQFLVHVEHFK